MPTTPPLRGRQAEAARNDAVILDAARRVFLRDPSAPMSAVAEAAGVGVAGLYRRYAGKDDLLRTLCGNGLRHYVALAEQALDTAGTGWDAFVGFVTAVVDADVHSLTVHLAGTFRSTDELRLLAQRSGPLVERIMTRAHDEGALRDDVTAADLPMILEQLSAVRVEDAARTTALRERYLALLLMALRTDGPPLPGPPPTPTELGERWRRSH